MVNVPSNREESTNVDETVVSGDAGETSEIEARFAMIEERIAYSLSEEQISEVKERIGRSIALAATMRTFSLHNADEPEIGFAPYRGTDR